MQREARGSGVLRDKALRLGLLALAACRPASEPATSPAVGTIDPASAPPLRFPDRPWGERAQKLHGCMEREAVAPTWRREVQREDREQADIFRSVASPEILVRVSTLDGDRGGLWIRLAPTSTQCGLRLSYDERGVYGVLEPAERGCDLDIPIAGQVFAPPSAETPLEVDADLSDFDAFVAGPDELRAAIEEDLVALRTRAPEDLAAGRVLRITGYVGDVPQTRRYGPDERTQILAALDREIARRRATFDEIVELQAHILQRVPCLRGGR